jgi:DNA-binding transcriptional LysR family regulator
MDNLIFTKKQARQMPLMQLLQLIDEPWSLPRLDSAPGRRVVETFRACGLAMPRACVTCNSVTMHNALVANSDYLAMPALHVLVLNPKHIPVKVLPVKLPSIPGPTGITTLSNREMTPVARVFIEAARDVSGALTKRLAALVR